MEEMDKPVDSFLWNPWVILQVPLQPTLAHQWFAALLIEYLKFEKMQAETFHHYPSRSANLSMVKLGKTNATKVRINFYLSMVAAKSFLGRSYDTSVDSPPIDAKWFCWESFRSTALPTADVVKKALELGSTLDKNSVCSSCKCVSGLEDVEVGSVLL